MRVELYPVYSMNVHLGHFYNMDLSDREYYQVRFKIKAPVFCKTEICYERASCPNVIYPPGVADGYGITKTIEISPILSYNLLDDCFRCTVQVLRRFDLIRKLSVQIVLELYVLEHSRPPRLESFLLLTKRTLDVPLRLDKSLHLHRPIFFDSTVFSAVTLTVHSSLISIVPVRKKLPPDPPVSEKLRKYHKLLCVTILSTKSSLQNFIRRYSSILSSPLHIDEFNIETDCQRYEKEFDRSQNGWANLEQDAAVLSRMISQLFTQTVQMFARSSQLAETLHEEFDQMRMKRLGELFLFCENPMYKLQAMDAPKYTASQLIDYIRKSAYFIRMPKSDFYCSGTDLGPDNRTIVMEERYLPAGASNQSLPELSEIVKPEVSVDEVESPKPTHALQNCVNSFCLPLACTNTDDPYVINSPNLNLLSVNTDGLSPRRMSDPGMKVCSAKDSSTMMPLRRSVKRRKARSTLNLSTLPDRCEIMRPASEMEYLVDKGGPLADASSSSSSSLSIDVIDQTDGEDGDKEGVDLKNSIKKGSATIVPDKSFVQFVHRKENLKERLQSMGFQGYFYSDLAHFPYRVPYFSITKELIGEVHGGVHLVVLVHGLQGSTEDLVHYRNVLRLLLPRTNLRFFPSRVNRLKTWTSLEDLASNLLHEVLDAMKVFATRPKKLSFIAHSMGGVIIRAMLGLPEAERLIPLLHTLLTLNAPHCGLLYNQRAANWGVSLMRWWKQSDSLEQLCLRDAVLFRDTFLYKLSTNGVLGKFRYVLLVGSCDDLYVPLHSALISHCKAANKDRTAQGTVYDEMVSNLNDSMENSPVQTTLVKYTVYHSFTNNVARAYQVTGKAAHIAVIDDDVFVERLLAVSAVKYFV